MSDLVKEFCKIFWDVSYVFMRLHLPTAGVVVNEINRLRQSVWNVSFFLNTRYIVVVFYLIKPDLIIYQQMLRTHYNIIVNTPHHHSISMDAFLKVLITILSPPPPCTLTHTVF